MSKLRAAVIGAGYLGRFHAQKYAALPESDLVAVVDRDGERAASVATELGCEALTDHRNLVGRVDVVSVVVPTRLHHAVALDMLRAGIHVLVEKPITATLDEARQLVDTAAERDLRLQVGHLERFNPAVQALSDRIETPLFIESHRLAPFNPRGADVSVVLDLMIHDIDIILTLVGQPVQRIDANGVPVISNDIDIANARLQFENGCVANVTASRVSQKSERKMRLFQQSGYIALDFQARSLDIRRTGDGEQHPGIPNIESEQVSFEAGDALLTEIEAFLDSVQQGSRPIVSGEDGLQALQTAMEIGRLLRSNPMLDRIMASADTRMR
ncbi:Gfo/Idh/MocA family oxidoreductase [Methylonatrum kenyense]|uniref:Gfo/Idh/MocA family protein n=1 Tax=Methylonatrum kenyense TaxID=455253 RepID=UPI0020BF32FA|nr:Gfo/Idh/MocA family oxidoreductase [Methylonatrum kenyense]MCK8516391.1 Gfo/Idh/MocA family oxidoreductase [Methylonatrum kenyense]